MSTIIEPSDFQEAVDQQTWQDAMVKPQYININQQIVDILTTSLEKGSLKFSKDKLVFI